MNGLKAALIYDCFLWRISDYLYSGNRISNNGLFGNHML